MLRRRDRDEFPPALSDRLLNELLRAGTAVNDGAADPFIDARGIDAIRSVPTRSATRFRQKSADVGARRTYTHRIEMSVVESIVAGTSPRSSAAEQQEAVLMVAGRKTGTKAAKAASKVLRSPNTSKASKTAAASALSQRAPKSTKGKKK